ncbi:Crp/Fnr family transcriptional regulator [Tenacibaculum finnmarkense genomovar ulcerans]|uniref:Crp/Fnr family transcriptional regulator n=2 Tax=Tenacibaculum finnmarkense TaxID=2781243 RepID=UPI001F5495AE|nr:Crp/Fnr family transcriptional regulator [Tenacibaculum finnmarkense]MCD8429840.1 Crp/Fnr family transcriptional regulator [Tenacibaculum finnmarkense genomovar ulcerans]
MMKNFFTQFDFQSNLLFEGLKKEDLQLLATVLEPWHIKKGANLFIENAIPTGIFQIKEGRAKKFKKGFSGDNQIFYIYTAGDLLGYHALLGEERYQDSCQALDDVVLNFISEKNFRMLLHKIPTLKEAFIKNISHEFGVLANTIALLAQKDQNARLAIFLILLDHKFNPEKEQNNGIDLTRDDLANVIGTSRESLGRSLKIFKDNNWITIPKKIIYIKNKTALLNFLNLDLTAL